jgi:hypothetical protein
MGLGHSWRSMSRGAVLDLDVLGLPSRTLVEVRSYEISAR